MITRCKHENYMISIAPDKLHVRVSCDKCQRAWIGPIKHKHKPGWVIKALKERKVTK